MLAALLDERALAMRPRVWPVQALLLEAIARDALGDTDLAERALERSLDLAEPEGLLIPFLLYPAAGLLERHRRRRTSHAALISEILDLLAGRTPPRRRDTTQLLSGPLTESETRVLRYLPTNLSAPEIAGELYLSLNTIRTHMRHLYSKLASTHSCRGRGTRPRPRPTRTFLTARLTRRRAAPTDRRTTWRPRRALNHIDHVMTGHIVVRHPPPSPPD